jgi:hypothetical protein
MTNPIVVERKVQYPDGRRGLRHCYWCPGCDALHCIAINPVKADNGAGWTFTGTLDNPTYSPSQLTSWEGTVNGVPTKRCCHTFIRGGRIEFLRDSTHALAGQTVPLPPLPDWVVRERPGEAADEN